MKSKPGTIVFRGYSKVIIIQAAAFPQSVELFNNTSKYRVQQLTYLNPAKLF